MGDALIDIRKLKELVKLMVENDLSEIDLGDENEKVVVKRGWGGQLVSPQVPPPMMHAATHAGAAPSPDGETPDDDEAGLHAIKSPMVGTFYSAPDPESPPYAKRGTEVEPESVVCIVEAMKVFSEIKAECRGTVEKVCVNNGDPVEYGQTLFLVRTS